MPRPLETSSAVKFAAARDIPGSSQPLWRPAENLAAPSDPKRERILCLHPHARRLPARSAVRIDRELFRLFARHFRFLDQRHLWNWTLVNADADRSDDAAPFLNLTGNEAAELFRAHSERVQPHL
jgi:hypothetical protein